jgi:hypothetical protein
MHSDYGTFIAGTGLLEKFGTIRKEHRRRRNTPDDAVVAIPPAAHQPGFW